MLSFEGEQNQGSESTEVKSGWYRAAAQCPHCSRASAGVLQQGRGEHEWPDDVKQSSRFRVTNPSSVLPGGEQKGEGIDTKRAPQKTSRILETHPGTELEHCCWGFGWLMELSRRAEKGWGCFVWRWSTMVSKCWDLAGCPAPVLLRVAENPSSGKKWLAAWLGVHVTMQVHFRSPREGIIVRENICALKMTLSILLMALIRRW